MASKYFTEVKNLSATAGGASGDVVYTCPSFHVAVIQFINISNGATSAKKYSIQWYEAATTTYHTIIDEVSLAASTNESLLTNGFLALREGDKIVAFEESSSDFHITVSGEEHFKNPT